MNWSRQDKMTIKERKVMKEKFLNGLLTDPDRRWKNVTINGMTSEYMISDDGILASLRMCKYMKPGKNSSGYLGTILSVNGQRISVAIHRLVAIAFIPNPFNYQEVNHKDGNKENNCYLNLEWVDHHTNIEHAIFSGLRDEKPSRKYSDEEIHEICQMIELGFSNKKISKLTGKRRQFIKQIRLGKRRKKIASRYSFYHKL